MDSDEVARFLKAVECAWSEQCGPCLNVVHATGRDLVGEVARLTRENDQLRAALLINDGPLTVCSDCGNGWDSEIGETEHHTRECVLATPSTIAGDDHSAFG